VKVGEILRKFFGIVFLVLTVWAEPLPAETLTFIWHEGPCADAFSRISRNYPEKNVTIVPHLVPYGPEFHDTIATGFTSLEATFDFAMWDSQSTAEFASAGHAVLMNRVFEKSAVLTPKMFDSLSLTRYGEYPDHSGQFWSLPVNQDVYGLMYRKDLLENPKEKKKFTMAYGYELGVPQTYQQARDIAEFFTRPEERLYGWGQMGGQDYDFASTTANSFLWSFGGELYNPKTFEVQGYINSPASVDGIQSYIEMFRYGPPGSRSWGWEEVSEAFQKGQLAMAMQWYFFFHSSADPQANPFATRTGFANLPGAIGRDGKFRRQVSLGGQGMGINKHSKKQELVVKFMEWYFLPEQQRQYAKVCQTGLKEILLSSEWQTLNAYNKHFAQALPYTNDYWHLPEYPVLLAQWQEELVHAITRKKTVQQALNDAAHRHETTLREAGYKITRTPYLPEVPDQIITPVGLEKILPLQ
jgi:multiple sugar transport system substrate-binding protein